MSKYRITLDIYKWLPNGKMIGISCAGESVTVVGGPDVLSELVHSAEQKVNSTTCGIPNETQVHLYISEELGGNE